MTFDAGLPFDAGLLLDTGLPLDAGFALAPTTAFFPAPTFFTTPFFAAPFFAALTFLLAATTFRPSVLGTTGLFTVPAFTAGLRVAAPFARPAFSGALILLVRTDIPPRAIGFFPAPAFAAIAFARAEGFFGAGFAFYVQQA